MSTYFLDIHLRHQRSSMAVCGPEIRKKKDFLKEKLRNIPFSPPYPTSQLHVSKIIGKLSLIQTKRDTNRQLVIIRVLAMGIFVFGYNFVQKLRMPKVLGAGGFCGTFGKIYIQVHSNNWRKFSSSLIFSDIFLYFLGYVVREFPASTFSCSESEKAFLGYSLKEIMLKHKRCIEK